MDADQTDCEALSRVTRGIEEHMETGTSLLATSLSDRELASIAWPGENWSALSPEACEKAIDGKLNSKPLNDGRTN